MMRTAKGNGCVFIPQLFQYTADLLCLSSILVASVLHNLHKENGIATHVKVKGQEKETSGEGSEGQGEIKQAVDRAVLLSFISVFACLISHLHHTISSCVNRADI